MLAGGFQGFEAPTTLTEIYHPTLNVWIFAGSESIVRSRSAGAVLRDGRFLLTGGYTNCFPDCTTATTEINRPVAEAFVQLNASLSGGSSSVGARGGVGR